MKRKTWVLVAHQAGARFFRYSAPDAELKLLDELQNPVAKLKSRDIITDRPGRKAAVKTAPGRHDGERDTRPALLKNFIKGISKRLEDANARQDYNELILVAEPQLMGHLRGSLSRTISAKIRASVAKDFARLGERDVLSHLRADDIVV